MAGNSIMCARRLKILSDVRLQNLKGRVSLRKISFGEVIILKWI
jgi:hypothetical protein